MDDICTLKILMFYLQLSYLPVWVQVKFSLYGSFWGGFPMSATKQRNFTKRKMLENLWDGFWYQPYIFQTTNFPFSPVMRGGRPKGTMSPFFTVFSTRGFPQYWHKVFDKLRIPLKYETLLTNWITSTINLHFPN